MFTRKGIDTLILVIGASAQNSVLPVVRVSSVQTIESNHAVQNFV